MMLIYSLAYSPTMHDLILWAGSLLALYTKIIQAVQTIPFVHSCPPRTVEEWDSASLTYFLSLFCPHIAHSLEGYALRESPLYVHFHGDLGIFCSGFRFFCSSDLSRSLPDDSNPVLTVVTDRGISELDVFGNEKKSIICFSDKNPGPIKGKITV